MVIWSKFHMAHVTWVSKEMLTIGNTHPALQEMKMTMEILEHSFSRSPSEKFLHRRTCSLKSPMHF